MSEALIPSLGRVGCGSTNHSVSGSDLLPGRVNPRLGGSNQLLGGGSSGLHIGGCGTNSLVGGGDQLLDSVDVDDGYTLGVPLLLLSIVVGVVPLLGNARMVVAITDLLLGGVVVQLG